MTYIHIAVDFQNPTNEDFEQFCTAMACLDGVPVHVHCIANYRVSAFSTGIGAMCSGWMKARLALTWKRYGTRRVWAAFLDSQT